MLSKLNSQQVERNKKVWERSLCRFEKSKLARRQIPLFEKEIHSMMKLPKEKDVLGRFFYFAQSLKSKSKRVSAIGLEIQNL